MTRVRYSIGYKLGAIHAGVVALLVAAAAVIGVELFAVRTDARQIVEETREARVASALRCEVVALAAVLEVRAGEEGRAVVGRCLDAVHECLEPLLEEQAEDPSREDHEAAEDRIVDQMADDLRGLQGLAASGALTAESAGARIERMLRYAVTLAEETAAEAEVAGRDAGERSGAALVTTIGAVLAVGIALASAWWAVRRAVVLPLRALHLRAEAVGVGQFEGPPPPTSRDEIGVLARAFERMSERVREQQQRLEEKVETRTKAFVSAARHADLGVLAAGIAHEINNPLASITACAEGVRRRLRSGTSDPTEVGEDLDTILGEAFRAREITGRLLHLARPSPEEPVHIQVAALLDDLRQLARHGCVHRGQTLELAGGDPDLAFWGDRGALLQALHNLVINASDASPEGSTIRVGAEAAEGGTVVMWVDDQGHGVPAEIGERVFEPFFTTKEPGHGTGLGLALVAATAESHGGETRFRALDPGTRFEIVVPRRRGEGSGT